jgi:hypothetical protein
MHKNLLKFLALETIEKVIRLRWYLSKASTRASHPDRKVIEIYLSAISEILKTAEIVIDKLHDRYGELDECEYFCCMRRVSDIFNL